MIIIGYQGIGKSTLCAKYKGKKYIDLESSNFWVRNLSSGKKYRPDRWEEIYANMAADLSRQGYIVFTSSHATVRKAMLGTGEHVACIVPDPDIKDKWLIKLEERHKSTLLEKDFKAWANAKERYKENIEEIMADFESSHIMMITGPDYDLEGLINLYCMTRDTKIMV